MPSAAASPASRDGRGDRQAVDAGHRRRSARGPRGRPRRTAAGRSRPRPAASRARGRAGRACGAAGAGGSAERPRAHGNPAFPAPRRLRAVRRTFAAIRARSPAPRLAGSAVGGTPARQKDGLQPCRSTPREGVQFVQHPFPADRRPSRRRAPDRRKHRARSPRWPRSRSPPRRTRTSPPSAPSIPPTGFPAWFQDATGLKLGLCLDGRRSAFGAPPTSPARTARRSTATPGRPRRSTAAGIGEARPRPGGRVQPAERPAAFMRVRVDLTGAAPNTTYTCQHPYGTMTVTTDAAGGGRSRSDTGCALAPCPALRRRARRGEIGPVPARGTPTIAGRSPANTSATRSRRTRVTGSPTANSFVVAGHRRRDVDEPRSRSRASSPARRCPVINARRPLDFGSSPVGVPVEKTITVRSFGVPARPALEPQRQRAPRLSGDAAAARFRVSATRAPAAFPSGPVAARSTVQFVPTAAGR